MPWNGHQNKSNQPPDLEALFKKLTADFKKRLTTGGRGGEGGSSASPDKSNTGVFLIGALLFLVWLLSGIYIVSPAERAVIVRFGKYVRTEGPGPHWLPRFIEGNYTINVQRVGMFPYKAEMLTKDENIVSVELAVQYRIDNAENFLFNVVNPIESLKQATASALRQVVGQTTLDEILTTGRQLAREKITIQLRKTLSLYQPGLLVTDVTLLPAKPPEQVTEAFDDAIKAREDEQRYMNKAVAYQKKVTNQALGQTARLAQEADAFRKQTVFHAHAETAEFLAILPRYKEAPKVTRERLYLETIEQVLSHSTKMLVTVKGASNLMYLPIDKLLQQNTQALKRKLGEGSEAENTSSDTQSAGSSPYFQTREGYPIGQD